MKKIIFAAIVILFGVSAGAQVKVSAGYVSSTSSYKFDSYSSESVGNGFYAGGSFSIPLGKVVSFNPGLAYEFINYKSDLTKSANCNEHYLNVPLEFQFSRQIKPSLGVFAFAGPTVQVGLASKWKLESEGVSLSGNYYGSDYDYGRFDALIGAGIGVNVMRVIQIRGGFNYGLVNRDTSGGESKKHRREFTVGLAYMF